MSLDITIRRYEHVVIEGPIEERDEAFKWRDENGYTIARGGWSGPALGKREDGPTYDITRFHLEGERELP